MEVQKKSVQILLKQKIMRRVLLALLPCVAGSVYFFGWRCLFLVICAGLTGFLVEFVFTRRRGEPVTEAVKRNLKNASECEAYLCGSPGMIDAAIKIVKELEMSENKISYDKFT